MKKIRKNSKVLLSHANALQKFPQTDQQVARFTGFVFFLLLVLGFAVYSNTIEATFQFDDRPTIINNPTIKNLQNFVAIWRWDPSRFLTHLTFAINFYFHKLAVSGYHYVNIVIHIANAMLVFGLCHSIIPLVKRETQYSVNEKIVPFFTALFFLVHPLQTGAVTYIVQRSTLLMAFFYISCLLSYTLFRLQKKRVYGVLAFLIAVPGIFCKPNFMSLPLMLMICEMHFFIKSYRLSKKVISHLMPFFLLVMMIPVLLTLWRFDNFELAQIMSMTREAQTISRWDYLLTQFNVIMNYFRLFLWPVNQNLDYDFPIAKSFWLFPTWLSCLVLMMLLGWAIKSCEKNRLMAFGIFWIFATLFIESSIFPISDVIFEHRMYLPMLGFSLLFTVIVSKFIVSPRNLIILLSAVGIVLAVTAYRRNAIWRDPMTLWTDVIKKSPQKARPYLNLGIAYVQQGNFVYALELLNKAAALDPDFADVYSHRGYAYKMMGNFDEALKDYNTAITLKPDFAEVFNNRGYLYADIKEYDRALSDYNKALDLNPNLDVAYNNRGNVYLALNDYEKALDDYNRTLALNPTYAKAYHNRGTIYRLRGQFAEAIAEYTRALSLDSHFAMTYYHRSLAYAAKQDARSALEDVQKAQSLGLSVEAEYLRQLKEASRE